MLLVLGLVVNVKRLLRGDKTIKVIEIQTRIPHHKSKIENPPQSQLFLRTPSIFIAAR